jgi:hypothetical protein
MHGPALASHGLRDAPLASSGLRNPLGLCGLTAFEPPIRIHMKLVLRLIASN